MTHRDSAIGYPFDVVVIGSGFGGAAVACRLAQAGRHVAILAQVVLGAGSLGSTEILLKRARSLRQPPSWLQEMAPTGIFSGKSV